MRKLKREMLLLVVVLGLAGFLRAETYEIDPVHSQVGFRIRHIVSHVNGHFDDFAGKIDYDEKNPEALTASVTIKTASVNTAIAKRDEHLRSPDFFNAQKFPEMTFKTTGVKSAGNGKLEITGDLTLLGVTKPVTLHAEALGAANDQKGNSHAGFSATGTLNRKDYGMVFNMAMDKGGLMLGDDVELLIDIEAVNKKN